jgi:hypothetical protein
MQIKFKYFLLPGLEQCWVPHPIYSSGRSHSRENQRRGDCRYVCYLPGELKYSYVVKTVRSCVILERKRVLTLNSFDRLLVLACMSGNVCIAGKSLATTTCRSRSRIAFGRLTNEDVRTKLFWTAAKWFAINLPPRKQGSRAYFRCVVRY